MKGLTENTEDILNQISRKDFLNGFTFIGGSAIAVQIDHRLSEISVNGKIPKKQSHLLIGKK